mmetsp:Transcript_33112/g.95084  ORF Transcript_33112/g.95084 Transcript_33112/m.95084 type:complete len:229 (-) Transcript_33112:498-1184(-)
MAPAAKCRRPGRRHPRRGAPAPRRRGLATRGPRKTRLPHGVVAAGMRPTWPPPGPLASAPRARAPPPGTAHRAAAAAACCNSEALPRKRWRRRTAHGGASRQGKAPPTAAAARSRSARGSRLCLEACRGTGRQRRARGRKRKLWRARPWSARRGRRRSSCGRPSACEAERHAASWSPPCRHNGSLMSAARARSSAGALPPRPRGAPQRRWLHARARRAPAPRAACPRP